MTDTSLGFRVKGRINGGEFTIQDMLFKDTETLTKGDVLHLETGEVDLGATGDTNLIGVAKETISGTDSTTRIQVYTDPDLIMEVYDQNARLVGATLDIAGTTGAMTLATSSNKELVVYEESTATEPTLVIFNVGAHHRNTAQ